jgi:ProP effector
MQAAGTIAHIPVRRLRVTFSVSTPLISTLPMSSTEPLPTPADELPAADVAAVPAAAEPTSTAPKPAELSPAACAQQLKQRFPALFSGAPKPIKLRVQVDIQARAPGVFSKNALSAFFRRYTGSTSYLIAVANGKQRFDLDGQPQGDISDEHRQIATDELARRRANHAAAQTASREAEELQEQKRRNRAQLLHDYERTTLTRANFCVLKGVAEADLDGYLATAREEAAQPRGPDVRGPRDARDVRDARGPQGRRDDRGGRDNRGPAQGRPRPNSGGRHGQ